MLILSFVYCPKRFTLKSSLKVTGILVTQSACLHSLQIPFWLLVTERAFLTQKTNLFSYWPCSKNNVRNAEKVRSIITFEYFSLRSSVRVIIKNWKSTKVKRLNKICFNELKKICYTKIVFCKIQFFDI